MIPFDHDNLNFLRVLEQAKNSGFYQGRLAAGNWDDIPLTTKEDLRTQYPLGMLAVPSYQVSSYHESSGSSGQPTATYLTERDWDDIVARFLRSAINLNENDWVLIKTPYALVTTAHQMQRAAQAVGATVVPADNRSTNMPYPKVVRLLYDLPVTVAWCLPTEVALWAKCARLHGYDPQTSFPNLRAFWVAGESLAPSRRKAMEKLWGKSIFVDYGCTETGSLAGMCSAGKLHIWEDRIHFELKNSKKSVGQGSLVVTPYQREAMPLLRYDLGDIVELGEATTCSCGSTARTLEVKGRLGNSLPWGEQRLFPSDIEDALFTHLDLPGDCLWRAKEVDGFLHVDIDCAANAKVDAVEHALGRKVKLRMKQAIVDEGALKASQVFAKPRYLLNKHESWQKAIVY